tara:strand:+ start:641 stop:1396 length:756 start_codon:yes stop_codon:yes gene_type:complete
MSSQLWQKHNLDTEDLTSGKIPFIIIPNVISESTCASLSEKIFKNYKSVPGPGIKNKLGTSLGSHIYEKSKYFLNSKKSNTFIKNIFSDGYSPLKSMRQIISQTFQKQISTASENKMSYSDCVIRIHNEGDSVHLHRDNCNFEMPDYDVSKYKNQLSAILYLQSPEHGGELTVYDKQWNRYDERSRQPDFGYSFDLVNCISHTSISPTTGSLVILNPNFYHKVESVHGNRPRVSIGFFFAESSKYELSCWT